MSGMIMEKIDLVIRKFQTPSRTFRPIAWWMLNGDLKPEVMRYQLEAFARYGFGGYATYPYRGLKVPYHSVAWWQAMAFMLDESRRLGLEAWILDEYNWPSGHCAGYILRDRPWLRSTPLRRTSIPVLAEEEAVLLVDGEIVSVVFEQQGQFEPISDWRREKPTEGTVLRWKNPTKGSGTLHVVARTVQRFAYYFAFGAPWSLGREAWGNTDLLNPEAIQASLQYTAEEYARRFPDHLGRTIKGFFTDENVLAQFDNFPYTPEIEAEFAGRYGYELPPRIAELFLDTGRFLQTRYDYWRIVADWIGRRYYGPYRAWCDDHGVQLIGHLCGEEHLRQHVQLNGDVFEAGRRFSHPGADALYGVTGFDPAPTGSHYAGEDTRAFHLTLKLAQSTAKHAGAGRVFNEGFTCEDYATSPHSIKRACNYYAALGVSQFCLADFNYSYAGLRKRRGGSKCFGTPWNRFFPDLTDYLARLSVLAAAGIPEAQLGLVYPRTTAWVHFNDPNFLAQIDILLYNLLDALIRSHWPFDFVYEQLLETATATNGGLNLPHERYRVLIAPGCRALPRIALDRLEEFVRSGGSLLIIAPFAEECPDAPDVDVRRNRILAYPNVHRWNFPLENPPQARMACDRMLSGRLNKPLILEGPDAAELVVTHRKLDRADLFLAANMSDRTVDITTNLKGPTDWQVWDLETGTTHKLDTQNTVPITFAPGQAVVLSRTEDTPRSTRTFHPQVPPRTVLTLDGPWKFSLRDKNLFRPDLLLSIDYAPETRTGRWKPLHRHIADCGLDAADRSEYWLKAEVNLDCPADNFDLVVDGNLVEAVWVNDQELPPPVPAFLWHQENLSYNDLRGLKFGLNTILARCRTECLNLERLNNIPAVPLVLRGSFQVSGNRLVPPESITPLGPWPEIGYPHFSGTAVYETHFDLTGKTGFPLWLELGRAREVAEVWLNGIPLGHCLWPPYRFQLDPTLFRGTNHLRIAVTSGIANLLPYGYTDQLVENPVPYGLVTPPRLMAL